MFSGSVGVRCLAVAILGGVLYVEAADPASDGHVLHESADVPSAASEVPGEPEDSKPWYWYDLFEREGFVAAGVLDGSGSARGIEVGYGVRVDSDEMLARAGLWLWRLSDGPLHETALRGELVAWPIQWGWGATGPLLGLGLNDRSEAPHEGVGGFFALGWEMAVWSPQRWQLMVGYERDFGISSATGNTMRVSLAYAHKNLTIGSVGAKP